LAVDDGKRKVVAVQRASGPPRPVPRSGFMVSAHAAQSGRSRDPSLCLEDEGGGPAVSSPKQGVDRLNRPLLQLLCLRPCGLPLLNTPSRRFLLFCLQN
jgi:hypothetical protein